jgi:hypothetical protein
MPPFNFDESFIRFCFWLTFTVLLEVAVFLPLFLYRFWKHADDAKLMRELEHRELDRIADALENDSSKH